MRSAPVDQHAHTHGHAHNPHTYYSPGRHALRKTYESSKELAPLKFLFIHYKCTFWFFECIESLRRVAFVSVLPLLPSREARGMVGYFMAFAFSVLFQQAQPYQNKFTSKLATIASYMITLTYVR